MVASSDYWFKIRRQKINNEEGIVDRKVIFDIVRTIEHHSWYDMLGAQRGGNGG